MVSGILVAIISLMAIGAVVYYITVILPEKPTRIERPTFIDFSMKQDGSSILIQNGGISNISAGSLKVYFGYALTQVTNKNDIPPASAYT
ncbi:MAG: hypothetical protein AABW61_03120, partial [Candidatus Aenigmatarchaeota archaeon]